MASRASILFFLIIFLSCKKGEVIGPDNPDLSNLKDMFDLQWLPSESFGDVDETLPIQDGMPVWLLKDGIGNFDVQYTGEPIPSIRYTTPPVFKEGQNGEHSYIFFPNAAAQYYGDNNVPKTIDGEEIKQPFTVYAVVRRLQAINNEAYWARGFTFRNRNDNHYQLAVGQTFGDFNDNSGILEANKISIVKVIYNGPDSKIWINNIPYANGASVDVGSEGLKILGYGTVSHIAHHDFFGFWMKFGLLNSQEDELAYKVLSDYFEPDEYPPYPIANDLDIKWDNATKSWTINYEYLNPDSTKTEVNTKYQWYIRIDGQSLEEVYPIEGATSKTLIRADYPNDFPQPYPTNAQIYCGVQVDGTWRELHSPYEKDNIK